MSTTVQRVTIAEVAHLSPDAFDRLRSLLVAGSAAEAARFTEHQAMVDQLRDHTDADSVLERELAEAGAARAREAMTDIEDAIQRLESRTYGFCESCGTPIPFERLEAIPSARSCVACPGRRPGWSR
jgi:DnaK suppressor protein